QDVDDIECIALGGETQVLDFDEETQKLEYLEYDDDDGVDENVRTQVVDDSDDEGTDRTEVLSDGGCDGDRGFGDDDQEVGKDYVVDSDASNDAECNRSGSVRNSFQSVRGSLLASGIGAQTMTLKENNNDANFFHDAFLSREKDHDQDDRMDGLRLSAGLEVTKIDPDHNVLNSNCNMIGNNDETSCEGSKSTVRKFFDEYACKNDTDCYDGSKEVPELPANDQRFAGLSYVESQEPGEFSQANALGVVDRYLEVSHIEFSQKDGCGKTFKSFSPPISRAKGTHILAKTSSSKSPVSDLKIYDWVDSYEDEDCRSFSNKRTGTLIRSRCYGQKSVSRKQKPKYLHNSKGRCETNKPREKEGVILNQKLVSLSCPDTRVLLPNVKQNDKMMQSPETSTKRDLSNDMDEQINAESLEKPSAGICSAMDFPDAYNIGFDTQMAAEAMEALCHGDVVNRDTSTVDGVSENVKCGSARVVANSEALTKCVYVRKRVSSDSVGRASRSKRRRRTDTEANNNYILLQKDLNFQQIQESRLVSVGQKKLKKEKTKAEEHPSHGISAGRKEDIGHGSSKSVRHKKTIGCPGKLPNKDIARCGSLSMSNDNVKVCERRVEQDSGSFTPIACRTRRANSLKPLTGLDSSSGSGVGNDLIDVNIRVSKGRGYHLDVDAPGKLTINGKYSNSGSFHRETGPKSKLIQLESPEVCGTRQEIARNDKCGLLSYSRVERTCRSISSCVKGSNLDLPSTVSGGQDVFEQYIPKRKRSKDGVLTRVKSSNKWGTKLDANILSFPDSTERNGKLQVTLGNIFNSSSTPRASLFNCTIATETPSHFFMGQKRASSKTAPNASNELTKSRDMASIRVLLSNHLEEDIIKQQQKISSRLGLSVVSSSSEATHFIADKFLRTRNMLEAIAFGRPVVTHLWLETCGKENSFVDEKKYILRDLEKEKEIGFSMPESLSCACHNQLLQGKRIFVTPNVKPSRELVSSLATAVHGQVVKRFGRSAMKGDKVAEDFLVLSCEEDYATCVPLLLKRAAVYSSELLLNGIVIQKLEYERHRLFKDHDKRTNRSKRTHLQSG
ncbi:Pax-interacting protein, partial [Thalictrum thalictroides]